MSRRATCEVCGYVFGMNLPAVDQREAPYYTRKRQAAHGVTTDYICSSVCMQEYLKRQSFTEPKGPNPPDY